MNPNVSEEAFVTFPTQHVLEASQSLIAASSILGACADQYANTGSISVGAIIHSAKVIDEVIEKLGLAELPNEQALLPF